MTRVVETFAYLKYFETLMSYGRLYETVLIMTRVVVCFVYLMCSVLVSAHGSLFRHMD